MRHSHNIFAAIAPLALIACANGAPVVVDVAHIVSQGPVAAAALPETYHVDRDVFSAADVLSIEGAYDVWCAAVGYCPARVRWQDADSTTTLWRTDEALLGIVGPEGEHILAQNAARDGVIRFTPGSYLFAEDPAAAANGRPNILATAVHEIGHFCVHGHLEGTIMDPYGNNDPTLAPEVVAAWKAGCSK